MFWTLGVAIVVFSLGHTFCELWIAHVIRPRHGVLRGLNGKCVCVVPWSVGS